MKSKWRQLFWGSLVVVAAFYIIRHVVLLILVDGARFDIDLVVNAARRFMANEPVYRVDETFPHTKPPLLMGAIFPAIWIPHQYFRLIWDLLIFSMPWLILRSWLRFGYEFRWRPAFLLTALMYPFWYKEAEYGQYNLVNFWLVLLAGESLALESKWRHWSAGALAAFTVVLKPTQIYLVPWLAVLALELPRGPNRLLRAALGAATLIFILSLSYMLLRSPEALLADHLEWARFLPRVTAQHLMGANNYGLPTLLTRLGFGSFVSGSAFLPVTLVLAFFVAWWLRSSRELSVNLNALLMLAFSPMAWRANFGIFIGLAYGLGVYLERKMTDRTTWSGLVALLIFAKASEYWLGPSVSYWFGVVAAPLWLVAAAILCLETLRRRDNRVLK